MVACFGAVVVVLIDPDGVVCALFQMWLAWWWWVLCYDTHLLPL